MMFALCAAIVVLVCIGIFSKDDHQKQVDQDKNSQQADKDNKDKNDGNKDDKKDTDKDKQDDKDKSDKKDEKKNDKPYWGIDSASAASEELYACTKDNYGKPQVWARYLGDTDVSKGLTKKEAAYLHGQNTKILLIYNHLQEAVGYDDGKASAEKAVKLAKKVDAPEKVAIFADIEPTFKVNSAFLQGWYETLKETKFNAGIYGDFSDKSNLAKALDGTKKAVKENTILWSSQPQTKETSKKNAPSFKPNGPKNAELYGWQYAIEAKNCEIDMNLFKDDLEDYLW